MPLQSRAVAMVCAKASDTLMAEVVIAAETLAYITKTGPSRQTVLRHDRMSYCAAKALA